MTSFENETWRINIENSVKNVCQKYDSDVAESIFKRYNAHDFYDLPSCFYSEVFSDLEQILND